MSKVTKNPKAESTCSTCHGTGISIGSQKGRACAELCGCIHDCPVCQDTGFVAVSDDFRARRKRCVCQRASRQIQLFNHANIPARYAQTTRESFNPKGSGTVMKVFKEIAQFEKDYQPGQENRGFVVWGKVGTGKTHLLIATLRDLMISHGVSTRFVEFSHLVEDLKAGFDQKRGTNTILDPLASVEVLAIDELGKGRGTEFERMVIDELISRRYNAGKTLLASTNYECVDLQTKKRVSADMDTPWTLGERVGSRVFSRLTQMCDMYHLDADTDYRKRLNRKKTAS